jgi:poly(hydroxyalkanoate) depolymerase family esterase
LNKLKANLMNKMLPPEMLEAARLTKAGRLSEATTVIQGLLHRQPKSGEAESSPGLLSRVGHWLKRRADFEPQAPLPDHEAPAAGQFLSKLFSSQIGSRTYKLYVPSGYHGQKVPLIVMLHGCTQSPDDFAAGTRMNARAEARVCLVAYPAQTREANLQKCWNWFSTADQQRDAGEPSLIAGITREVMHDYAVDPPRVYVAGLSAGGAAAAIMGDTYPDLYAAIGVHSGVPCGAAHDMKTGFMAMKLGGHAASRSGSGRRVPVIVFHGDRDSTVSPRNGEALVEQAEQGLTLTTRTQDGTVPGGHGYSRTVKTDPAGKVLIEQWTVHGAGHAWSGGSPAGSFTDAKGPDATAEMLRFFLEHPRQA